MGNILAQANNNDLAYSVDANGNFSTKKDIIAQGASFAKGVTLSDNVIMSGTGTLDVQKTATFTKGVTFDGTVNVTSNVVAGVNLQTLQTRVDTLSTTAGSGSFGAGPLTTTGLGDFGSLNVAGNGKFKTLNTTGLADFGTVSASSGMFGTVQANSFGKFKSISATGGLGDFGSVNASGSGTFGSLKTTGLGDFGSVTASGTGIFGTISAGSVSAGTGTISGGSGSFSGALFSSDTVHGKKGVIAEKGITINNGGTSNNWQIKESDEGMLCFTRAGNTGAPYACINKDGNLVAGTNEKFT